ncbi:RIP metalloprotease [Rhodoblastus acidophilus]|uniref:RIP metalloprotease n=1 Tax=Candidatus Rhodoblastus alkanivorans TaxID=2954117 RepID=A0ABS9Z9A0_9HYPH|nr:M50 family metallopeptidase [Candidatus Rhodoblastus alkanivorans]MCI4680440.1 RIP metalloprotease [Candidatus Rhodoblastus alkanivorans]MCI4683197.1 RIP metalloprotease [Candidatus Rhodoblastus alkanivorans]MDI4640509.1 RIP metalloprotease [Rhodoblastus acidophilus]
MSLFHSLWTLGSYLVPFLFVLSLVVFFHEFGHFLVGRLCGVKVDAFSLGFGPELAHYIDRHGTRWRLAALPLGGYVRFHGDANGASEPDFTAASKMPEEERKVSFFAQKVWKRAAVVAAGPFANFVLAILIFTGLFYFQGREVLIPRIAGVVAGSPAAAAGFQKGDLVLSIGGQPIRSFADMQRIVSASGDVRLQFVVQRDGKQVQLEATPAEKDVVTPFGTARSGMLGVSAGGAAEDWRKETYNVPRAAVEAARETWFVIDRTAAYLGGVVIGRESPKQLSGPIRIAEVSGEVARAGIWPLFNLAAILSISIGLLNLLPIPLLDGGHLLYYAYEAARGRALTQRAQEFGFRIGLAFVAVLMLVATYNDLVRITRQWLKLG